MKNSTQKEDNEPLPKRVVFYDGECGFCSTTVQFILKRRKKDIYFAPLQSEIAKDKLGERGIEIEMNTLYFLENEKLYLKSTGALRIARHLNGGYPLFYYLGIIFPKFIRDWVYDQVAKRRHQLKADLCPLPQPEEQKFFIDD